ncbi:MAG: EVE domain-containing protein [Patescibacteria group bacterium]
MAKTPNYWIMKSEPDEFSIDDLQKKNVSIWDGIRNYQVRNMIRDGMNVGDRAFFYHSSTKDIGIVGEMEVVERAYPDPSQFKASSKYFDKGSKPDNPRWLSFDVQFVAKFPRLLSLAELKLNPKFETLPLVRKGNRLSIMPITKAHYEAIKKAI